jgi:hypothetical protein
MLLDFTKADNRDVTLAGQEENFKRLRDSMSQAWGEDDDLVGELTDAIAGNSASTMTFVIESHLVGDVADFTSASEDDEERELGDALQAMIEEHNDAAIAAAEEQAADE